MFGDVGVVHHEEPTRRNFISNTYRCLLNTYQLEMKYSFLLWVIFGLLNEGVSNEAPPQEQTTADVTLVVMEGEPVTLESGHTEIPREDLIVWTFGSTRIAQMNKDIGQMLLYDGDDGMFRGKLELNNQTGDLTITNIKTEHTGFYYLQILSSKDFYRRFIITVKAPLPVPIITRNSSSLESSKCVLSCSVCNVSDVSLSWYKGMSLLSSISVSEHISSISLHLECVDDSYTCVLNNSMTNQTQHLNKHHCHKCSAFNTAYIPLIVPLCVLIGITAAVLIYCWFKSKQKGKQNERRADMEFSKAYGRCSQEENDPFEDDVMTKLFVKEGECVTLQTHITIMENVEMQWKFAGYGNTIRFKVIVERRKAPDGNMVLNNGGFQDKLQIDSQTGSLTITDFNDTNVGYYKLLIPSKKISMMFDVTTPRRRNTSAV